MRFAIYYAPEQKSPLHHLGSQWLGLDAYTLQKLDQPGQGFLKGKTEPAARYGFHATLKAPFKLTAGKTEHHVKQEARALATLLMPPTIERLIVSEIDGFLALVPERPCVEVDALAAKCVRSFDHLRAAPDADEVARRLATGLTPRQSQYLADWGYPYVFEEFRFHITLSARLNGQDLLAARKLAESHFAAIHGKPFTLRNFTLFIEAEPGGQFQVLEQFSVDTSIGAAFA